MGPTSCVGFKNWNATRILNPTTHGDRRSTCGCGACLGLVLLCIIAWGLALVCEFYLGYLVQELCKYDARKAIQRYEAGGFAIDEEVLREYIKALVATGGIDRVNLQLLLGSQNFQGDPRNAKNFGGGSGPDDLSSAYGLVGNNQTLPFD